MGNQICLTETQIHQLGSPNTKWNREQLRTGSQIYSKSDKENFFKLHKAGPAIPQYKNQLATSKWELATEQSNISLQIINSDDTAKKMYYQNQEFDQLVMLGPPKHLRWSSWKALLLETRTLIPYERMLERPSRDLKSIVKDIDRTFVNHELFQDSNVGQDQLKRVLCAISNSIPVVGYCQGMNFVAGFLLVVSGCDETYAFHTFMQLLLSENHLLFFNYADKMPLHSFLVKLTRQEIKQKFPAFHKRLTNVSDAFWISKMILSLFLYVFKMDDCTRIWDYLMSRGTIRGIPEIIIGFIEVTLNELMKFNVEDFGINFQGHTNCELKFNIGEVIFAAKQNNTISRQNVSRLAQKIRKTEGSSTLIDLLCKYNDREGYKKQVSFVMQNFVDY